MLVRDIAFNSHCEHHMMPFMGKAHIAYKPVERVVGLSKLARLVDVYGRRLQTQEHMTSQIATAIEEIFNPRGVAVMLEAEHMCMSVRGVEKPGSSTITTQFTGSLPRKSGRAGAFHHHGPHPAGLIARRQGLRSTVPRQRGALSYRQLAIMRVGRPAVPRTPWMGTAVDQKPFAKAASPDEQEEGLALTPKFDADGLVTCVATDARSGEVLMVAHMSAEALRKTIESGEAWYYSRSRRALWRKGEQSGHVQRVVEMRIDCDQDAVWIRVEQAGAGACHTGRRSCFYRAVPLGQSGAVTLEFHDAEKAFDPNAVYGGSGKAQAD